VTRPRPLSGLITVAPGAGEPIPAATLIGRAEWAGGLVCVLDQTVEPGILVAAHRHTDETQGAYVLSGSLGFYVDGEEAVVPAGSFVVRPAGSVHALWNPTDAPARMLEITSPAERWQRFAFALREFHAAGSGDAAQLEALARDYGTFLSPDVTAELVRRHGVTTGRAYSTD
jgi:mannose-6-phosphate isomerase-like protein (cupin superfamily)